MRFVEVSHKYVDEGEEYTPVTSFLKSFQEYVDWDKEAEKKAKKLGITKEEMLAQWAEKRVEGASRGTAFHKFKEDDLGAKSEIEIGNVKCGVSYSATREGIKEDDKVLLEDNTVYLEKMIWSKRYKICGTADIVEVVNGKINIKDYKTNKKLDMSSWVHPTKGPKRLLFPLGNLDDCNFNVYQLQLNTYMYMLLQHNRKFKIGTMTILHVRFKEDGSHDMLEMPVKNLQREVRAMMEHFKTKNNV